MKRKSRVGGPSGGNLSDWGVVWHFSLLTTINKYRFHNPTMPKGLDGLMHIGKLKVHILM